MPSATVTVRQLLSHTAGFEGDIFRETGNGDDAIELLIAGVGDVPQLFAPGEQFSYNNLAYCLLGRLVEVLREKPYSQCLHEHLFAPLGLTHAATNANEAIVFRAAMGHVSSGRGRAGGRRTDVGDDGLRVLRPARCSRCRPRDLLAFAKMHLNDGKADDGTVVLSPESVRRCASVRSSCRSSRCSATPGAWAGSSWTPTSAP